MSCGTGAKEPQKYEKKDGSMAPKNVELVKLGGRIRYARKLLGFSQNDFATKCGLNRSHLGRVERGAHNVTFGVLCTICDGLTCDIATITRGIPHLLAV
jgi:transcriptional regulator with XRE-family HTH domain